MTWRRGREVLSCAEVRGRLLLFQAVLRRKLLGRLSWGETRPVKRKELRLACVKGGVQVSSEVERQSADVINFKILYHGTKELIPFNWFHPRPFETHSQTAFETDYISEGAAAFRKKIFATVGYYPEDFFISHEGYDLAYRLLDRKFKIIYSPDIEVYHKISRVQRESWRNSYYDTRNYIWLIIKYYPPLSACRHLLYRLCTTFLFALRRGQPHWYLLALRDAIRGLPIQLRKRQVLGTRTTAKLKEIRRYAPGLGYKIGSFIGRTAALNKRL